MAKPQPRGPVVWSKCKLDARTFNPQETAELLGHWADNPLIIRQVIQPLAKELQTTHIWEKICPECAHRRIDRVLEDNSNQRNELSDDQIFYGDQW